MAEKQGSGKGPVNETGSVAAQALWYEARGRVALRPQMVAPPGVDEARVRMRFSGLSRGTERLVLNGLMAAPERERMSCPLQEGTFPFPVKYGYCAVGTVEAGPEALLGRDVFCLHPHQDVFNAPVSMLAPLPADVPARRAVLAANMETALNAVWDSGAGPGDRIVVVGAGVLGVLIASLCAQLPGADVMLVDIEPQRAALAKLFGIRFSRPIDALGEADVTFNASATGQGLACALACAGDEARVVEVSWYGDHDPSVPLGAAFHARRLQIVSSQVGMVATSRRPRWTYQRRLAKAVDLLRDARYDALLSDDVAFADLPQVLPSLLAPNASGLTTVITY